MFSVFIRPDPIN